MSETPEPIDRRDFLKAGAGVALASLTAVPTVRAADVKEEARAFLAEYVKGWLPLETASAEADWLASTDVSDAHTTAQMAAKTPLNAFVGAPRVIETARRLLARKAELDESTVRQLEEVLLRAAESPGTIPEVVKQRIEAEAKQSAAQDGFVYTRTEADGSQRTFSANDLDRVLVGSTDLAERQKTWELAKTIGGPLRAGLLKLRDLRNKAAQAVGHRDYFALQVADYGMTPDEMLALCDTMIEQVTPLYKQVHTWGKHALARRYGVEPLAGPMPAHWLTNRWAQNWPGLVEGIDLDGPFRGKTPQYIVEQAERFYVSLGFPKLPASFYTKSDLYPADPKSGRKKNSHASAWHINMEDDVRSLMSVEPDNRWFTTAHHELGHIYYYMSYSRPEVPHLLRGGANRAFHEGVGDLIGLAASQPSYLKSVGLLPPEAEKADPTDFLLDAALDGASVVFLPFAAGVMTRFEHDFYAGKIPDDGLNAAWWSLAKKYQGIVPPGPRPEDSTCDAATKTHINDDPGQYYDYAIGTLIKFQLHNHIAREILKQDPRDCNYYGNAKVGTFLKSILSLGATRDWNTVLKDATGEGLSAKALVAYFEPLRARLEKENVGRAIGW